MKNFSGITDNLDITTKKYVDDGLAEKANSADLATVATSGSYNDLSNKPTNYVTTNTTQTISGSKTFTAQPIINTSNGLKFTSGNCALRIYNTSASPTDYSAIEVRSNSSSTNRNLFIDLANNSLVVGQASGNADTTYKVNVKDSFNATTIYENGTALADKYLTSHQDVSGKANLNGGNTFSGEQFIENGSIGDKMGFCAFNYTDPNHPELAISDSARVCLDNGYGTAGQVFTSQGENSPPIWTTPSGGGSSDNSKHGYTQLTNENLNTITEVGWYRAASGNTCTNRPSEISNGSFFLNVEKIDDAHVKQEIYVGLDYVSSYTRNGQSAYSGGTIDWSGWSSNMKISDFAQTFSGRKTFSSGINLTNSLQVGGSNGTSGQVLTSQGAGNAPIWTTPSGGGGSSDNSKHGYTELTNEDLNTITEVGWYRAANGNSCTNRPTTSTTAFILVVEKSTTNYVRQTFYFVALTEEFYNRSSINGGSTWKTWITQTTLTNETQNISGYKSFLRGINVVNQLALNGKSGSNGQFAMSRGSNKSATWVNIQVKVNGTTYTADNSGLIDLGTISGGGSASTSQYNDIY